MSNISNSDADTIDGEDTPFGSSVLEDAAVISRVLDTDAVTAAKIAAGAVDTEQIAADAVTSTEVKDDETLPVSISGDADTVDGSHASDLGGSLSIQSPSDVSGSRSLYTQYSNTTGNPLFVTVWMYATTADAYVGGSRVMAQTGDSSNDEQTSVTALVPDGSTYEARASGSESINGWFEQEMSI